MSLQDEEGALLRLAFRGYLIHDGAIFYILNDDGDQGLEEGLIAKWTGLAQDAFEALEAHGWPTSPFLLCVICGEGEADFGGLCASCNRIDIDEQRGESILSEQRGK